MKDIKVGQRVIFNGKVSEVLSESYVGDDIKLKLSDGSEVDHAKTDKYFEAMELCYYNRKIESTINLATYISKIDEYYSLISLSPIYAPGTISYNMYMRDLSCDFISSKLLIVKTSDLNSLSTFNDKLNNIIK